VEDDICHFVKIQLYYVPQTGNYNKNPGFFFEKEKATEILEPALLGSFYKDTASTC
jgi:hypothetical protein